MKVKNYQVRFKREWEEKLTTAAEKKGIKPVDYIRLVVAEAIQRDAA